MTEPTTHFHMADEFRIFVVTEQPQWAVLQVTSQETGERFRFGLRVEDLDGLADRLKTDAQLLKP